MAYQSNPFLQRMINAQLTNDGKELSYRQFAFSSFEQSEHAAKMTFTLNCFVQIGTQPNCNARRSLLEKQEDKIVGEVINSVIVTGKGKTVDNLVVADEDSIEGGSSSAVGITFGTVGFLALFL